MLEPKQTFSYRTKGRWYRGRSCRRWNSYKPKQAFGLRLDLKKKIFSHFLNESNLTQLQSHSSRAPSVIQSWHCRLMYFPVLRLHSVGRQDHRWMMIMNWERIWKGPDRPWYLPKTNRNHVKTGIRIAAVTDRIRTQHLPKRSLQRYL